jgi:hypothetical protein
LQLVKKNKPVFFCLVSPKPSTKNQKTQKKCIIVIVATANNKEISRPLQLLHPSVLLLADVLIFLEAERITNAIAKATANTTCIVHLTDLQVEDRGECRVLEAVGVVLEVLVARSQRLPLRLAGRLINAP